MLFFFHFFKILFYILTSQYCIGFAIYQNESATGIHVFPTLNPPPSSLLPPHTIDKIQYPFMIKKKNSPESRNRRNISMLFKYFEVTCSSYKQYQIFSMYLFSIYSFISLTVFTFSYWWSRYFNISSMKSVGVSYQIKGCNFSVVLDFCYFSSSNLKLMFCCIVLLDFF